MSRLNQIYYVMNEVFCPRRDRIGFTQRNGVERIRVEDHQSF